ncbi:hypothetical protein V1477_009439 [Vespula maculifrons]|uniref:Uncharacterized protein n=1 Tax=Vespula maculifrons TaxID=7453 RepID=A0ABD2C9T7_VESMC
MSSRLRRGNEAPFKREYKTLKRSVRRRLEETMEGGGGGGEDGGGSGGEGGEKEEKENKGWRNAKTNLSIPSTIEKRTVGKVRRYVARRKKKETRPNLVFRISVKLDFADHLIKSILWTVIVLFEGLPVEIEGSINLFIFAHLSVVHPGYWSGAAESKSTPMTASSSF